MLVATTVAVMLSLISVSVSASSHVLNENALWKRVGRLVLLSLSAITVYQYGGTIWKPPWTYPFNFNFSTAPKEEAYFKMLGEDEPLACRMKESHLRNKDKKSRLSLLLAKSGSHENVSPEKKPPATNKHIPPDEALKWSDSFEDLLSHSDGVEFFTRFLRTEFSEENIEFWLACEDFKSTESSTKLQTKARQIYAVFIDKEAPKEVNIDHSTKTTIEKNVLHPTRSCFDVAQDKIYSLMKRDCYPRFLTSDIYLTLTKRKGPVPMTRRRSRSFVLNDRAEGTAAWL